jgi:nicotinamidase-related amidase
MNKTFTNNPALILIDIQKGFDDPVYGKRNNPDAEANAGRLLNVWRKFGYPIFHIQHLSVRPSSPLSPSSPGSAIKEVVKPENSEPVITKNVNSAFIGTDLESRLHAAGITQVVLAGITTDHCVSTSTRMAANLGFDSIIAFDATAAFDRAAPDGRQWSAEDIYSAALASLHGEFATGMSTDDILKQLSGRVLKESVAVV